MGSLTPDQWCGVAKLHPTGAPDIIRAFDELVTRRYRVKGILKWRGGAMLNYAVTGRLGKE